MELEITLREASVGLKSLRATERKKCAETIKEFLSRNAVPSLLKDNTLKNKGYTWNHLFDDINEYILKETEKYETSKTYDGITVPLCTSLLHLCVAGSNKGKTYIKCDKITDICLYVLNDNRLFKAIGDAYLNLLFKYILPCDHYLGYIAPKIWKDLLNVCVAACISKNSKLDHFTRLRLVALVLKSGNENSQFVRPVIESLPLLEKYFVMISNDRKVQDVITEVITLLLEMLSSEYRLTMSSFIESMLSSILKFYDQNKDQKKKMMLFKLLYYTITLHHPQGRQQNEEGSLANDWDQWNRSLNSITELVCLEVGYIQKARRQSDRTIQKCTYFHDLAASVYYQVFKHYEQNDIGEESVAKKLRLSFNKNNKFNDLINELQQNHIPWLAILNVYVKKYGSSISAQDFSSLLNCLQMILTNNCLNLDWDVFEEVTCLVLQNLYCLMYKTEECDNILICLWNSCIRNCASINTSHKATHTIIQNLLQSDTVKHPQAQQLIKLYLENDMPLSSHSVTTLSKVFQHCYSKFSSEEYRTKCVSWLTVCEISSVSVKNVTELLFRLLANENVNIATSCSLVSEYENLCEILFNSNEKCILFTKFEIDNSITALKPQQCIGNVETVAIIENHVQEFFKTVLTETISKFRQKEANLLYCIKSINIIVSYLDIVLKHNIKTQCEVESMEVFALLKKALTLMYSAVNAMLQSSARIPANIETLQLLKELLITETHCLLTSVLRSSIDGDFFHGINNILSTEVAATDSNVSVDDEDEMNFDTLKHNCFFVLAAYCRKKAEYREELLKLILDSSMYNFNTDLQCIFQSIKILTDSDVEDPPLGILYSLGLETKCQQNIKKVLYGVIFLSIIEHITNKIF